MKSAQLQIRLTPEQKALLQRRARAAGEDVSHYVLSRVVPASAVRFVALLAELEDAANRRFALAHLSDLLDRLPAGEFARATGPNLPVELPDLLQNIVAAMIEHAATRKRVSPPAWVREIPPLASPWFAADLGALRAHLVRASPTAFRRRNLFVDSAVGDRV